MNSDQPYQLLLKNGVEAYESARIGHATDIVRQCLAMKPDEPRATELQGLIQYSLGNYEDSVHSLEVASLYVPLRLASRVCLAHGYGRIGRKKLSGELLAEVLADTELENRLTVSLLLQIGAGLDLVDRPDLAVRACRRASMLRPNAAQIWYDLGYYTGRCGGSNELVEEMARRAIRLEPENTRFRIGLAGLLVPQDRQDEAFELVKDLTKCELESVNCACCLRRLAGLYEQAHDYRRAILSRQRLVLIEDSGDERC